MSRIGLNAISVTRANRIVIMVPPWTRRIRLLGKFCFLRSQRCERVDELAGSDLPSSELFLGNTWTLLGCLEERQLVAYAPDLRTHVSELRVSLRASCRLGLRAN